MFSSNEEPSASLTRRQVLVGTAALAASCLIGTEAEAESAGLAMPGPYRGRVIEVFHPGSVMEGKVQKEVVQKMMASGMCALTGAKDETAAWKRFFNPGDVVAIKGAPVGRPLSISQKETILEVIRGLTLAGVPHRNIIMYERYREELLGCEFDKILPGVDWGFAAAQYDNVQTGLEGYDATTFVELPKVMPGVDANDPVNHRSHLANILSKRANKIINVCCLKDHASAGITMALKNMSHGFTNNVCRTHSSWDNNWCGTFIPAVAGMKKIREKVVLHIGDGLIGTYDGGPGNWNSHFRTWEYRSLFFATDPVAMDRIGWEILDKKRVAEGLPRLAEAGIKAKNPGNEQFDHRQPEHVLIAGKNGLGEADLKKIVHRQLRLGR